jgi:uncharacterized pyridoxal phosphate-containing UPF0001 family protein
MVDVAANYRKVIDRITEAALKAGRNPQEIKLLAAGDYGGRAAHRRELRARSRE